MKQENDNLSERLQQLQAIQIISANGTGVCAEDKFQDGNPSFWIARLTKQLASCALSNLTNAQIYINEICRAHFDDSNSTVI
jgi:hypothetical protein